MAATLTYSTTIPAVSFEYVAGGAAIRVRREGKGDTILLDLDTRGGYLAYNIIKNGEGVIGRVAAVEGNWIVERGIFRNWDYDRGAFQVFPSSTVQTFWGFDTLENAVAEEALYWLS
jgi:hypothetical protein